MFSLFLIIIILQYLGWIEFTTVVLNKQLSWILARKFCLPRTFPRPGSFRLPHVPILATHLIQMALHHCLRHLKMQWQFHYPKATILLFKWELNKCPKDAKRLSKAIQNILMMNCKLFSKYIHTPIRKPIRTFTYS